MKNKDEVPIIPKVYRAMKCNPEDKLPVVGTESCRLGARVPQDIAPDEAGMVGSDKKGISVGVCICCLPPGMIPRKLRTLVYGADGSNNNECWVMGNGPFQEKEISDKLTILPDTDVHAEIIPSKIMKLDDYQDALASTRPQWSINNELNNECPKLGKH